jgi:hypothetical protein
MELMSLRGISAFALVAILALPVWAQSDLQPQQVSGCPAIHSNPTRVHTRYADLQEIYDDLHTVATSSGRLCAFDIYLRNSSETESVMAEVTFYANGPADVPPTDPIAGPYQIPIPANHAGPIQVDTPTGDVQRHMWVGVRFLNVPLDGQGFIGLVDGPPEVGASHDLLYSKEGGNYVEFGGLNADIYVVVYSNAPRSVEDSTWGKVKGAYR